MDRYKTINAIYKDKEGRLTTILERGCTLFCAAGCDVPVLHPTDLKAQKALEDEVEALDSAVPKEPEEENPGGSEGETEPSAAGTVVEPVADSVLIEQIEKAVYEMNYNDIRKELDQSKVAIVGNPRKPILEKLLVEHRFWMATLE